MTALCNAKICIRVVCQKQAWNIHSRRSARCYFLDQFFKTAKAHIFLRVCKNGRSVIAKGFICFIINLRIKKSIFFFYTVKNLRRYLRVYLPYLPIKSFFILFCKNATIENRFIDYVSIIFYIVTNNIFRFFQSISNRSSSGKQINYTCNRIIFYDRIADIRQYSRFASHILQSRYFFILAHN